MLSWASAGWADEVVGPSDRDFSKSNVLERLARRMEPDLVGRPERLQQYVDFLQTQIGNDKRLFAFQVTPEADSNGKVQLRGYIEFPETRGALSQYLEILGFAVEDQLETIPSTDLGEAIYGVVKVSHSFSYDRPGGPRTSETDCLIGEPLYLLREENDHLLAHSGEGYLGYIRSEDVERFDATEFDRYTNGPIVRMLSDVETDGMVIPEGARLKWISSNDDRVTAELPTGEQVKLSASSCVVRKGPAANIDEVVKRAKQLLGTDYKWGGRTSDGIDCSGLVQIGYATAGLHLPRDSYQQFYVGQMTATRWNTAGLRRGDTLYFLGDDGKIRHTAMYLGNDRFIQAVSPEVRINSFNPKHDNFDLRRTKSFAFAKRPVE